MENKKEKVYLFKVSLKMYRNKNQICREMTLKGTSSLHEFARTITGAFNFQLDHAFGFYSNVNDIFESNEVYTLFKDDGGMSISPNEQSVKNSYIHTVFEAGKKMLFLFDYGDEWRFVVECCGVTEAEVGKSYPQVTKEQGEAPPQYLYPSDEDYSDEECSDEEC